jgi:hypothetical protein
MFWTDSVIGTSQPCLEITESRVSPWLAVHGVPSVSALSRSVVDSHFGECPIGGPGVGMNCCSLRHNRVLNKRSQYGSCRTGNHGKTNAPSRAATALDRDGNSGLARSTPDPSLAIAGRWLELHERIES